MTRAEANTLLSAFGSRVRHQRVRAGLTQADVAAAVGLSGPAIANIERAGHGAVNILTLQGLRRTLRCSADWLLDSPWCEDLDGGPMLPVTVAVGDNPARCIGYVSGAADLPGLLRTVADHLDADLADPAPAAAIF